MKKLSLILVLIMTLSLMVGALTTIAFAAGDGTQANPITVGGEGADYATVGEALAAIGTAEGTTYIKVTGDTTETVACNTVATDVVIYSEATGDARPTITLPVDASMGSSTFGYYWVMVDGAEFTIEGIKIDTSAFNTDINKNTAASGTFIPKNGAKISVVNCFAINGGTTDRDGGFIYFRDDNTHYGDIVIDNSTITSDNRGVHWAKSKGASSISVINGSSIKSSASHAIQASITTMPALTVRVVDSTLEAPKGVGIYNRSAEAVVELINATVTTGAGKQVLDARNDKATLDFTVVGGTFSSTELLKLKSPNANIIIVDADLTKITSAIVNNEGKGAGVVVTTANVTYGECKVFKDVPTLNEIDRAVALAMIYGYYYDAETKTYFVATADGFIAAVADIKAVDNAAEGGAGAHVDDANIVLVADIDMKDATKVWDPICNYSNGVYVGTIDGQGHTIKNFTDKNSAHRRGLIARAGACTVKNITFVDPVVTGGKNNAFIVADIFGGNNGETVTIENCNIINGTITSTGSYIGALIGCGTKALDVVIKNCVVDADVVGTDHVGLLIGGESATIVDPVATYTIEGVVASGTVTGVKNAGMTGYFCDINVNVKNVVSTVKAIGTTETTNISSLMANAKRCNVTLENVITEGALIASAEDLKAHAFVLKNVTVLGDEAAPVFKAFTLGTNGAPTLTIDGEAADLANATVSALSSGFAHKNIKLVIFAQNAGLRDAALALIPHEHVFDQEVAEKEYLSSNATCTEKAKYFKSCICTEKGEETFEVGDLLPHVAGKNYEKNDTQHWAPCTACGTLIYFDHVFDQEIAGDDYLVSDATCTTGAVFYKSCVCGHKGEETFMSIGSLGHLFGEWTTVTEPTVDAEGVKERECSVCGEKETKSIEKLPAPEAPAEEPTFVDKAVDFAVTAKNWVVRKAIAVKNKAAGALGCGGSIGGTSIIIMLAAAGAVIARKKED